MPEDKKPKHQRLAARRSFDIIPRSQARPSSTARPVVVSNKPQQSDNTLTKKPQKLMRHTNKVVPLPAVKTEDTPAANPAPTVVPAPATPPATVTAAPVATPTTAPATPVAPPSPAPASIPVTAPAPPTVSAAPVAATPPAVESAQPSVAAPAAASSPTTAPAPPVPEVGAPPVPATVANPSLSSAAPPPADDPDEFDLAALPGVHGLETDRPVAPAPAPGAAPQSTTAAPAEKPTGINQTPQQAMEMAAALRDMRRHPVAPPSDRPVVVVHRHDWLRSIGTFVLYMVAGIVFALIVFNLLLDAGVIQLPIEAYTNFFQ